MNNTIGGYTFKDSKMLGCALTHASHSENNYERLEFLGDSILDFLVADLLYENKNLKEAELTRARASLACEDYLCKVFDKLGIEKMVRLGKSCKTLTKAIRADIIESLLATIYIESGIEECKQFIVRNFDINVDDSKDYKTLFLEYVQKHKKEYSFNLVGTTGPAHDLCFYVELCVDGKVFSGSDKVKVGAEKECARQALKHFKQI